MWVGIDFQTVGTWNLKERWPKDMMFVTFWRLKTEPFVTGSERAGRSIGSEKRRQVRTEEECS